MAIAYIIIAKYTGRCLYCGRKIEPGDKIAGEHGVGAVHARHFSMEELGKDGFIRSIREWKEGK